LKIILQKLFYDLRLTYLYISSVTDILRFSNQLLLNRKKDFFFVFYLMIFFHLNASFQTIFGLLFVQYGERKISLSPLLIFTFSKGGEGFWRNGATDVSLKPFSKLVLVAFANQVRTWRSFAKFDLS